jgi:tetratricopeptide (TPR) repeat protein
MMRIRILPFRPLFFLMAAVVFFPAAAQDSRPLVTNIAAHAVATNEIKVSWSLPEAFPLPAELVVYRDTKPLSTFSQITRLDPRTRIDGEQKNYTDVVSDYREYYYAVIVLVSGQLYDLILPSINATVTGVHVRRTAPTVVPDSESAKEKLYPEGALREAPLPTLDMMENDNRSNSTMSGTAEANAQDLAAAATEKKLLEPFVFDEDMISPTGGDEYLLFDILHRTFARKKYDEAVTQLQQFLGINRKNEIAERASFYLGESYYFTGSYRNALQEFLQLDDYYPVLSDKWINSSLDLLEIPAVNQTAAGQINK